MTQLARLVAFASLIGVTTACASAPSESSNRAVDRGAGSRPTLPVSEPVPTIDAASVGSALAASLELVVRCSQAIKTLAFVGDANAMGVWTSLGQSDDELATLCEDQISVDPAGVIAVIDLSDDVMAIAEIPQPQVSPSPVSPAPAYDNVHDHGDLDCEDYGEEVWVGDYDPDSLDADGDGWGCEGW